jgi:hypothetical protein
MHSHTNPATSGQQAWESAAGFYVSSSGLHCKMTISAWIRGVEPTLLVFRKPARSFQQGKHCKAGSCGKG